MVPRIQNSSTCVERNLPPMEKNFGPLWFHYRQISLYYRHETRSHQRCVGWTLTTTLRCILKTSVSLLHYKWRKSKWCLCDRNTFNNSIMRMHIFVLPFCLHTLRAFWRQKKKKLTILFCFSVRDHLAIVKGTIAIEWIKDDRATYRAKHELLGDRRRKQMGNGSVHRYTCVFLLPLSASKHFSGREVWGVFEGSNLM